VADLEISIFGFANDNEKKWSKKRFYYHKYNIFIKISQCIKLLGFYNKLQLYVKLFITLLNIAHIEPIEDYIKLQK
jgi:hypothetical protein